MRLWLPSPPLSIIPAVLVLHTPRPKPTGLAFLVGWVVGLAALTAIFVEVSSLLGGLCFPVFPGTLLPATAIFAQAASEAGCDDDGLLMMAPNLTAVSYMTRI